MRSDWIRWAGVAGLLLAARPAFADTTWTGGGDGISWSDPANWGGTSPDGQRRAFINGVAQVTIDSSVAHTVNRVILADGADSDDVTVHMTGGSLTIAGSADASRNIEVGSVGTGTFRLSGGTVNVAGRVRLSVDQPPATPEGTLIIDGGTMSVADRLYVGFGSGTTATLVMSSGSLSADRLFLADGVGCNAVLNMTGGTITARDFWVPTNLDAKQSRGHVQLDGGVINATNFSLTNSQADNIIGTMDVRGGMLVIPGDVQTTLNSYVANGWLTGYGFADTGHVVIAYDAGSNQTTVTAIADADCFILTPDLPQGHVGSAYSAFLQTAPGCTNAQWQVVSGLMPDGLTLDMGTGEISGVPSVSGTYAFTVQMTADEASRNVAVVLSIAKDVPVLLTRTIDVWIREAIPAAPAYEDDRIRLYSSATNVENPPARRWGLVEFDVSSLRGAAIQGAALKLHQPGAEATPMKQSAFLIPSEPNILTSTWASYMANQDGAKQAFESFGRYDLPAGTTAGLYYDSGSATLLDLSLIEAEANGDGKLTLLLAPDENGNAYSRNWGDGSFAGEPPVLEVDVGSSCIIKTAALPGATQAVPYQATLESSPGCGPGSTWSISGCFLPTGLALDAATGVISGWPSTSGLFSFTVQLTPAGGGTPREVDLAIDVQRSRADLDNDGDVDAGDLATFEASFTGPAAPPTCTPVGGEEIEIALPTPAETWVRPSDPDGDYEADNVQVRSGAMGNVRIGLVEFDLSSLAGQSVQSAKIRMHFGSPVGGPVKCSAFLIPSGIAHLTYNGYLADKDGNKQPFAEFGRFVLAQEDDIEDSLYATAADLQMIVGELNGDRLLTVVLIADEDGTPYGRKWGDGEFSGPKPELIVRAGETCSIFTPELPPAVAGTPYAATLEASADCSGSLQWEVAQCALPPGLSLNAATGVISGTPRVAGSYPLQIQLTTAQGTRVRNFTLAVSPGAAGDFDLDGDVDLLDFDLFALLYTSAVAQRPFCGRAEFVSTDTPKNIPDGDSVSSVITVPPGITVGDLDVFVDVAHGAEVDVKITLKSPAGTIVTLKDFGGNPSPFAAKTYDDEGLQPAAPLSAFDGQNAAGDWTLTVSDFDTSFMDFGVLNSWKLIVTGE